MAKISDVEIPSLLFDDLAGDPSTPASGFSRIYTKSDGAYHIDDAGTVTGPFATSVAPGGALVDSDSQRYTGGNITVPQPNMAALTGPADLVVAASSGDILLIGLSARNSDSDGDSWGLDMATIVSASPVNYLSSRTGTPITTGVAQWHGGPTTAARGLGGSVYYVVQAGDISGGNVTLRHYGRASGAGKTIFADGTNAVFESFVMNFGQ